MAKKGGQQRKAIYDFLVEKMGVDIEVLNENHKGLKALLLDYVNEMTSDYQKRLTDFNNELPKSTMPKKKEPIRKDQGFKPKSSISPVGVWRSGDD